MKKTRRAVISILSLIIILTFAGSAFAEEACVIKGSLTGCFYFDALEGEPTNDPRPIPDAEILHFIEPTSETSRTQQAALEAYNKVFVSGEYTTPTEPEWDTNSLCYKENYSYCRNMCLETQNENFLACTSGEYLHQWYYMERGSYGSPQFWDGLTCEGSWDVFCGPDADGDSLPDTEDSDTVYGSISGDIQAGVTVGLYRPNCGGDVLVDTTTTDADGYYAFGSLSNGLHTILPELEGYAFAPEADYPKIPQAEIRSYDFTATAN